MVFESVDIKCETKTRKEQLVLMCKKNLCGLPRYKNSFERNRIIGIANVRVLLVVSLLIFFVALTD